MPVTHNQVIRAIQTICRKIDGPACKRKNARRTRKSRKPRLYQSLKTSPGYERLAGYIEDEINQWNDRLSDMHRITPKHQVVATLTAIICRDGGPVAPGHGLLPFIEDLADYLSGAKVNEERLGKARSGLEKGINGMRGITVGKRKKK